MARTADENVEGWSIEDLLAAILNGQKGGLPKQRVRTSLAREVAIDLLADLGGPSGIARASADELRARLWALNPELAAGAQAVASAFELGRRMNDAVPTPDTIATSADVARWACPRLAGLDHEELWLLALDGRSRVRAARCVAKGGLHGVGIRCADPLRSALRAAATGFVLVHNHPSGDPTPSREDIVFTRRLAAAAAVVDMPLLDHVVVAREGFASVPFSPAGATAEVREA